MLGKSAVSAIVFYVKSIERSKTFYEDVLGLTVQMMEGQDEQMMMANAGDILLVFFQEEGAPGKSPIVVFGLDGGIESIVEKLAARGVEIVLPVSSAPGGGLTADFLDPDGHILSIYQEAGKARRLD